MNLLRRFEVESFPRSSIQLLRYRIALLLGESLHRCSFGQILPDKTVDVFVAAPLPGVVWVGEVEPNPVAGFDHPVLVKLCSVIGSDCLESAWVSADQPLGLLVQGLGGSVLELSNHHEAGFSFNQGDDAVRRSLAHDRIDLPVPSITTALNALGAL